MEESNTINNSEGSMKNKEESSSADENTVKATSIPNNYSNNKKPFTLHGVEIFQKALPYVDNKTRKNINMMIKITELTSIMRDFSEPDEVSICETENYTVDTESMLADIRNICNQKEQDFVDIIINFMKAKKLYTTYRMLTSSSNSGDSGKDNYARMLGLNDNPNMMELLLSMLPPDQKSTFETLSMLMSTMT